MTGNMIKNALSSWNSARSKGRRADPPPQQHKAAPMQRPTDEQLARSDYARTQIRDEGRYIGFAYRRQPLIESLADKIGLTTTDLIALRYYRTAYERADASPTKSCLDIGAGGGGGNGTESRSLMAIEQAVSAKAIVQRCESAAGAVADTLRGVAVLDRSFSEIAIARFGGRSQSWIVDAPDGRSKVSREKIVPRSGRHREIIAEEFMRGTRALVGMLRGQRPVAGTGEVRDVITIQSERLTVSAAIMEAVMRSPGSGGIWIAEATLMDIQRERGDVTLTGDRPDEFAGIPLILRPDWVWGWSLLAPAEGACSGATEMA